MFDYLTNKYNFIKIDDKEFTNNIIKNVLIDYINNDPKFFCLIEHY